MEIKIKENKTTEFGLIPSDWQIKEFQDVMTGFFSGATPYRGRPEYYKGQINWITSGELNYNIITDTNEKITEEAVRNTNLKILPKGTFLFAITGLEAEGTRGSCAMTGIDATTNQSCMALFPFESLDVKYLYHYYVWKGKMLALRYCQGTKQQSYTGKIARKLPIILPPTKSEQTAIATALSDTDALIENLEKLIAKKRNIKQGVMQELLTGKKRLAGFSTEWRYSTLSKFVADKKFAIVDGPFGSQMKVQDFVEQGIPIVEMEHLKNKFLEPDKLDRYITHKKFEELIRSSVFPDDIIISKTGSLGYISIVPSSIEKALITSRLAKITLDKKKANISFVFQCLTRLREIEYWQRTAQGGTMLILSIANISHAPIPDISIYEQKEIADILDTMDNDIERLEQILYKYNMIKHGMMQALLTGKIRLI